MTTHEQMKTVLTLPSDREIAVTRRFNAPRTLVWQAYTQAEHLRHWWGPTGWSLPVCELDLRPGGTWFYCMEGPDGMRSCGIATYREIVAPERLVYEDAFAHEDGSTQEDMPVGLNTVVFSEQDGLTTVHSTTLYPSKEDRDTVIVMGVEAGIGQTFDRLEAYLPSLQ